MKYPLQIVLVTTAVFVFMAIILMNGTITFGTPEKPSHFLHVHSVKASCGLKELQDMRTDTASLNKHMMDTLVSLCENKPSCRIDTAMFYEPEKRLNNCTDEIAIIYNCNPDNATKTIFLYENQIGALTCEAPML